MRRRPVGRYESGQMVTKKLTERVPFQKRLEYASTGTVLGAVIVLVLTYLDPSRSSVRLAWSAVGATALWWIGVRIWNRRRNSRP